MRRRFPTPYRDDRSHNRTLTVGPGFTPVLLSLGVAAEAPAGLCSALASRAITAGGDFHPALRTRAAGKARRRKQASKSDRVKQVFQTYDLGAPSGKACCCSSARNVWRRNTAEWPPPGTSTTFAAGASIAAAYAANSAVGV